MNRRIAEHQLAGEIPAVKFKMSRRLDRSVIQINGSRLSVRRDRDEQLPALSECMLDHSFGSLSAIVTAVDRP